MNSTLKIVIPALVGGAIILGIVIKWQNQSVQAPAADNTVASSKKSNGAMMHKQPETLVEAKTVSQLPPNSSADVSAILDQMDEENTEESSVSQSVSDDSYVDSESDSVNTINQSNYDIQF